ncbi:hypothetical protein CDD80_4297 [Ophiocordyceps camponoti-rufipedis]|uniref:Uncharacterized protein n=1 Tax=Ophiocordyceps camponoti-rufipedis TaxID=2004952 RepID=A0A2C5YY83_9HYPO|nr:hypothetical protein CDD80_4297 [Ophiocordyceps camponoti-rufipedis]
MALGPCREPEGRAALEMAPRGVDAWCDHVFVCRCQDPPDADSTQRFQDGGRGPNEAAATTPCAAILCTWLQDPHAYWPPLRLSPLSLTAWMAGWMEGRRLRRVAYCDDDGGDDEADDEADDDDDDGDDDSRLGRP